MSVALWGTSGSGKTWLVHALGRILHTKYQREVDGLVYELETVNKLNYSFQPNEATSGTHSYVFKFERSRTLENLSQSISSFKHEIQIFDNQGSETLDQKVKNMAILSIAHADIVVIVLDPTYYIYGENSFLKEEYPKLVRELIRTLESDNNRKRYYAVCITKADYIDGAVYLNPDALIEMYFGEEMTRALKIPDPNRIKTFTTSSAGFIIRNEREIPNISDELGNLSDVENWQPYGVEFPFFWAFEELEKQSLKDSAQKSWWKKLNVERNLKKYIPYPKANYELPKAKK